VKRRAARAKKTDLSPAIDPRFAPVIEAFARHREVSSGKMMASVGLRVNGKIFAMIVRGKFVAKLPKPRVDEIVESGAGERFDPRGDGRLMKEWVVVEDGGAPWVDLAREAYRFVRKG